MIYTTGIPIYLIIGVLWAIYTIIRNASGHKSHREHWFTAGFFSFILWPIFLWNAWLNGFIHDDINYLRNRIR